MTTRTPKTQFGKLLLYFFTSFRFFLLDQSYLVGFLKRLALVKVSQKCQFILFQLTNGWLDSLRAVFPHRSILCFDELHTDARWQIKSFRDRNRSNESEGLPPVGTRRRGSLNFFSVLDNAPFNENIDDERLFNEQEFSTSEAIVMPPEQPPAPQSKTKFHGFLNNGLLSRLTRNQTMDCTPVVIIQSQDALQQAGIQVTIQHV